MARRDKEAREILERLDGIIFEGDVIRAWIKQLRRRSNEALERMKETSNVALDGAKAEEVKELKKALADLKRAEKNLAFFQDAVAKREGKSS